MTLEIEVKKEKRRLTLVTGVYIKIKMTMMLSKTK